MRSGVVSTAVFAGVSFLVVICVPACGNDSADGELVKPSTREQALCPAAQDVCVWWADDACAAEGYERAEVSAFCEAQACDAGAWGGEIRVWSEEGEEGWPSKWKVFHDGTMTSYGIPCVLAPHPHGNFVKTPYGHCAARLETERHLYFEFFAGGPSCHGWTECRCQERTQGRGRQ